MLDFLLGAAIYVVPFLIVLTVVITIHELGHFWAARACGVAIDRFSIGFGRPVASFVDKSGVEWRIGWIPLGGYVRFSGDTNDASVPDAEEVEDLKAQIIEKLGPEAVGKFYHFKPIWQRAIIAAAGPVANFILAFVVFTVLFTTVPLPRAEPVVGTVEPGTPAAAAGFQPGDRILSGNGRDIQDWGEFTMFVRLRADEQINFKVDRGGEAMDILVTPSRVTQRDEVMKFDLRFGRVGMGNDPQYTSYERLAPLDAVREGMRTVRWVVGTTLTYIGRIFRGHENGDQFSSVVGMANVSGKTTNAIIDRSENAPELMTNVLLNMVQMTALLSIGIGFVNLLPIPVLDGGHLMFYAYEAVVRRPVNAAIQAASFQVGLALVLGLMLFATWNDLQRMQAFEFLGGLFS